jgi:hypothetical protein
MDFATSSDVTADDVTATEVSAKRTSKTIDSRAFAVVNRATPC